MSPLSIFQSNEEKCPVHIVRNIGLQRIEKYYSIAEKVKLISIPFESYETLHVCARPHHHSFELLI